MLLALLVSSIGFVFFVYGKRQRRAPQIAAGLVLLIFPYFVYDLVWMSVITVLVIALVAVLVRLGL